jgi:hypothetical protein
MRFLISLIVFFGLCLSLYAQETERTPVSDPQYPLLHTIDDLTIAFTNVNLVSWENKQIIHDMIVLVRGDRILEVGHPSKIDQPGGARFIDAKGKYLLAGLIPIEELKQNGRLPVQNIKRFRSISKDDLANLILLPSNPLEGDPFIEKFDGMMIRGIWYTRETLLENPEIVREIYW